MRLIYNWQSFIICSAVVLLAILFLSACTPEEECYWLGCDNTETIFTSPVQQYDVGPVETKQPVCRTTGYRWVTEGEWGIPRLEWEEECN